MNLLESKSLSSVKHKTEAGQCAADETSGTVCHHQAAGHLP